jgi:hypothetical protein
MPRIAAGYTTVARPRGARPGRRAHAGTSVHLTVVGNDPRRDYGRRSMTNLKRPDAGAGRTAEIDYPPAAADGKNNPSGAGFIPAIRMTRAGLECEVSIAARKMRNQPLQTRSVISDLRSQIPDPLRVPDVRRTPNLPLPNPHTRPAGLLALRRSLPSRVGASAGPPPPGRAKASAAAAAVAGWPKSRSRLATSAVQPVW